MKIKKSEYDKFANGIKDRIRKARKNGVRKSANDPKIEVVKDNYCFSKYLRGAVFGDWSDAETERSMFKKALGQNVGTEGGFLVPTETSSEIIELLKAQAVVRGMPGVRSVQMASDKLTMRRVDDAPVISWGGESEEIAEDTNLSFGQVALELKKMVCLYKVSRELLMNANTSVDDLLRRELADAVALEEDSVFLEGTGGNKPLGFYYHPNVNSTDLSDTVSYDDILDGMYQIEKNNGMLNGWVAHPRTKNTLRQLKDGMGQYLYADGKLTDQSNANMGTLYGSPIKFTTQVPITNRPSANESYMVGGQWSNVIIGEKPGIRMETTNTGGDSFKYDQIWIKVVRYVDIALRHPNTFTVVKGIQS